MSSLTLALAAGAEGKLAASIAAATSAIVVTQPGTTTAIVNRIYHTFSKLPST